MNTLRSTTWCLLLCVASTAACRDTKPERHDQPQIAKDAEGTYPVNTDGDAGLKLTLSEAKAPADNVVRPRTLQGTPLDAQQTNALLARLPALPDEKSKQAEFAFRKRSKPAPRTGETVQTAFPPEQSKQAEAPKATGPLEVLRHAPEGDISLAPRLSVTFSQPMVAVTGQEDAAKTIPATIEPAVDGKWRWIGTRTALFTPKGERFPMATKYRVSVPDDLASASGHKLENPVSWTFATPPVQVTRVYPSGQAVGRDPIVFMQFDQRVEPTKIIDAIELRAGSTTVKAVRASDAQIAQDDVVHRLAEQARDGQWIAFHPATKLPAASNIEVVLTKGAPSAEGPRRTAEEQTQSFRTYDPLTVRNQSCTPANKCQPGVGWWVAFNNTLDDDSVSADAVHVEPELPGMQVRVTGQILYINGQSTPRTKYKVTLAPTIRDQFGQELGDSRPLSFRVGKAQPRLGSAAGTMTVLDPATKGHLPIFSVNYQQIRVRAYKVEPEDWYAYLTFIQQRTGEPPGKKVIDEKVDLNAQPDVLTHTMLDLSKGLDSSGHGQLIVTMRPTKPRPKADDYYSNHTEFTWIQSTDIALDGFVSHDQMLAWASRLDDGAPLDGVDISLITGEHTNSDKSGLATLELPKAANQPRLHGNILVAKKGGDRAFLPEYQYSWGYQHSNWVQREQQPAVLWHVFDDRGMYKPGEKVHLKGWVRESRPTHTPRRLAMVDAKQVHYTAFGPRGNKLTEGDTPLDSSDGFDLDLALPDDVNLGYARVQFSLDSQNRHAYNHSFQIQEFRRPEFEVSVSSGPGPHVVGQTARADVDAHYYAGGGLGGAPVHWTVRTSPGHYSPPNHDDFIFGRWSPWWLPSASSGGSTQTFEGHTGADGEHHLKIQLDRVNPPLPTVVQASASVTDVNRQTWSDRTNILVHPSETYVGLRSPRNFVGKGEPIRIDAIATDIDGHIVKGRTIDMKAARMEWRFKKGEWKEVASDEIDCSLTSADKPETCTFKPKKGGTWRITAIVRDQKGRPNMSQMRVWVSGAEAEPNRKADQQKVQLIPDKETYKAGDTAKLLVQAPFADAEALMTVRQNGIVSHKRFHIDGRSHTVEVGISESDYPNVYVQVDLVGADVRKDRHGQPVDSSDGKEAKQPAYATGNLSLKVPPLKRELSVKVEPAQSEVAPGTKTKIHLKVRDADGKPAANSEVAVVAVDEAILALTGYQLADPIASFYPAQGAGVADHYLQRYLMLATAEEALTATAADGQLGGAAGSGGVMEEKAMPMARQRMAMPAAPMAAAEAPAGPSGGKAQPIALRKDFRALALFAPAVHTDQNGEATVDLDVPDNLTRYRLMAVAVDGTDHFGKGESTLTARLPLMVRPSPPRFLNWGDRIEMPVVIQNQTDKLAHVQVAVRAANLRFGAPAGRAVDVPAGDRVEVRFKAVTEKAGKAVIQVATTDGAWSDAAQKELPVWTPATTEAFATYGTIDKGTLDQPVRAPKDAIEQFGKLEVTTSSTALQELTDALIYLVDYPFECSEQISSRVMGIAALRDVLEAFDAEGLPPKKKLVGAVNRDIKRLAKLQRPDGGFYLWSRRDRFRVPFVEVHITHALQRAKMKGFDVPKDVLEKAKEHVANIESYIPSDYSKLSRNSVLAYSYYVLDLMGDSALAGDRAMKLAAQKPGKDISMEAVGWLMSTLAGDKSAGATLHKLERYAQNHVSETAADAQFTTNYGGHDHVLMYSNRRTDAVMLDALMATEPKSDLIAKLVRGLLDHRTRGHWLNTQENVFVLLALDRYFETYEKQTPNFVANMWLGDGYVGEHKFKGRTTERKSVAIPMKALMKVADDHAADLVIDKKGPGRMYYRIGMSYAPESLELEPADYGFAVSRRYEAVDHPDDVAQQKDGTWVVKAGARVRVVLEMVAPARRYHVALVDPLPAGLEPLNPALAVTEDVPTNTRPKQAQGPYWWWFRPWYVHQNLRDERAEAFAPMVWAGVHEYSYVARATTPGRYVVPPTKAEEMYHPETFGRTGTARMVVK